MKLKRILKTAVIILVVCFLLGGAAVGAIMVEIQKSVANYVKFSQQQHPVQGDDVASLIAFLNSDRHTLAERNRAVWTLGRIADPRALDVLQKYYTGQKCRHDSRLCQHELEKAIKRCTKQGESSWVRDQHK